MLLIHCPYCEEDRPELEFAGAGEAHIARPANMAEISDDDFEKFFFIRDNDKGVVFERWRHIRGSLFPTSSSAPTRQAERSRN